ncbi:hypothetical protein BpHYR1_047796 [Brachionus plicatilis]|uniref:Uncharacterized protein n=1 Tax=Brachionus plicatilis TaxID=10195 RepID=A0A3M7RNC6_BRAPC|nr:hypothetical protein BpHYR1_047796 [Brachionus plicatilis]
MGLHDVKKLGKGKCEIVKKLTRNKCIKSLLNINILNRNRSLKIIITFLKTVIWQKPQIRSMVIRNQINKLIQKDAEEEKKKKANKKMETEICIMKEQIEDLKRQNQILESMVDRHKKLSNKENFMFNEEIKIRGKIDQLKTKLISKLENAEQYEEQK